MVVREVCGTSGAPKPESETPEATNPPALPIVSQATCSPFAVSLALRPRVSISLGFIAQKHWRRRGAENKGIQRWNFLQLLFLS